MKAEVMQMANGGQWDPTSLPIRPGLYLNFVDRANAQIVGGPRGIVGMPIFDYTGGTIEPGKFVTIENETQAKEVLGAKNVKPVLMALDRGAAQVLAYAVPHQVPESGYDYAAIRTAFEARIFNVFVFPGAVSDPEQDSTVAWVAKNRKEGKHFTYITGGSSEDDQDPSIGNARSIRVSDDYVLNLIVGGIDSEGNEIPSEEYAAAIAGLVAGTAINKSITYADLSLSDTNLRPSSSNGVLTDVNRRFTNSEVEEALKSGSLVLIYDGRGVKVEQGITTKSTPSKRAKIRKMRVKQAIATDIPATAKQHYIGKIDNTPEGRAALISSIKAYLEELEKENVLASPNVEQDGSRPSTGDCVFLNIDAEEVDSMERIFLTFGL